MATEDGHRGSNSVIALDVSTHNDESEEEQNDTLRNLKKSLSKLILNTIDEFEVLYLAQKLHQDVSEYFGFSQQKYLVQKDVLKSCHNFYF